MEDIRQEFQMEDDKARDVMNKLTTIGVIDKPDDNGRCRVILDKEAMDKRIRTYQELSNRMRQVAASKNTDLLDITITKKLIVEENEHAVKTRVPGLYGEKEGYIWIRKSDIMEIHHGKTLLTYLDQEKDYKIYSKDNRVLYTMKGEKLYSNHYDKVERAVREHYSKVTPAKDVITKTETVTRRR